MIAATTPTMKQWQQKVNQVFIMDKFTAKIQLKRGIFWIYGHRGY